MGSMNNGTATIIRTTTTIDDPEDRYSLPEDYVVLTAEIPGAHGVVGFEADEHGSRQLFGTPVVSVRIGTYESSVWTSHGTIWITHAITEAQAEELIQHLVEAFVTHGWESHDVSEAAWQVPTQWALDFIQFVVFDAKGRSMVAGYYNDGETDVHGCGPFGDFIVEYVETCDAMEEQMAALGY